MTLLGDLPPPTEDRIGPSALADKLDALRAAANDETGPGGVPVRRSWAWYEWSQALQKHCTEIIDLLRKVPQ